jgi:hypothetical protein
MGVREGPFTRPRQLKVLKFSPRPVFDAQHGRARRVFDLDPRPASPGTVGQIASLRDDAFEPEEF